MGFTTISAAHSSMTTVDGLHSCSNVCSRAYPLQNYGFICDPVVLVMSSIACLAPDFFDYVISRRTPNRHLPYLYLKEPTRYSKYLRKCIISWISEDNINIRFVVPQSFMENMAIDESESEPDCPIVDFSDE